ncbi:hypothetical protein MNBD_GAMMA05-2467 [hydrothermal vent metagenome]|uniref:Uncharacterized protein n=1 Tax=hydrothermal vent metagenome TaxID=652676 RepID=A0A3B0WW43_9ZZZZ
MDVFNKLLVKTLFVVTLSFSLNAVAADDYLLMLEAEAKSVQLDQAGSGNANPKQREQQSNVVETDWHGECDYAKEVLQQNLHREEFSSYLKQCSLSLFVFYRRLDVGSQAAVFDTYKNASPIKFSSLKKTIVNYL